MVKVGRKVTVLSFNNMVGIVEQVLDDGHILVNMKPSFEDSDLDERSTIILCIPTEDIGESDAWADVWEESTED